MEQSFWAGRWEEGMTGFHEGRVNPNLAKYFGHVGAGSDAHVLVPLCGKAVDVMWLSERVGRVTGVEFVEQAVLEFFAENDLQPDRRELDLGTEFRAGNITILRADIFDVGRLPAGTLPVVDAVWDRAALVALPPEMRVRYALTLKELAPGATLLLNSFDYDQSAMDGPPHSVPQDEVLSRYGDENTTVLSADDVVDRMTFTGHEYFNSTVYLISL